MEDGVVLRVGRGGTAEVDEVDGREYGEGAVETGAELVGGAGVGAALGVVAGASLFGCWVITVTDILPALRAYLHLRLLVFLSLVSYVLSQAAKC